MDNNQIVGGAPSSLPSQKLPMSKKTKKWREDTLNYYINFKNTNGSTLRSDRVRKVINYDLYNGVVNQSDVQKICDPLGYTGNTWADRFQHYDMISEPLRLLLGDEITRSDTSLVISEAADDINRKQKGIREKIKAALQDNLMAMVDPSTVDPNNPPPTPEEVLKMEQTSPSDMLEKKANKILKVLKKRLNTKWVLSEGFKDALIAGEEIYWTGILNNEPAFRKVNSLNITVILDDDSNFIDDAIAIIEERMLSIPTIIDEYGDELTQSQVTKLSEMVSNGYGLGFNSGNEEGPFGGFTAPTGGNDYGALRVMRVEWFSLKQVGTLSYTDPETGELVEELVDETMTTALFEAFKETHPDAVLEWYWINEAWEGVKIGNDIYVGIRPKPNQRRKMDNPYYCKLGYSGFIYEATNSRSVSLVDRLKPYQYLYDIISFRLEMAFASDQGKVFLMDMAQIPASEGIDPEKWIYYLKEMKIAFINSFEEGKKGSAQGKHSQFNQFQAIDLSLAQSIQQYINYLEYIKQQMYIVSGVSPQRMASINNTELVGNVEKSIQQSSVITEYLFEAHNEVRRRVYTSLIEVAKIAWRKGKVMQYVNDDLSIEMINIEEFEFENSDLAVFVSNMNKDREIKAKIEQLATVAMEQQKADLSTIIDTILNDSPKDIANTIRRAEREYYARTEQTQKAEGDRAAQIEQMKLASEERKWAREDEQKQKDRDLEQYKIDEDNRTKIQVAEIGVYSRQENLDQDGNGIPDPIEIAKQALAEQDINSTHFLAQQKMSQEKQIKDKELSIKENSEKNKLALEEKKIKAIEVQNKSQEAMQSKELSMREKELKAQERMKDKDNATKVKVAKMKPKPKPTVKKK